MFRKERKCIFILQCRPSTKCVQRAENEVYNMKGVLVGTTSHLLMTLSCTNFGYGTIVERRIWRCSSMAYLLKVSTMMDSSRPHHPLTLHGV